MQLSTRVAIETLGCKLNQAESEQLARSLIEKGYQVVQPEDGCDIYVLNTCTVTHIADRKARHLLRMARRQNPNAYVIATGCLAERDPAQVTQLDDVDLVVGNTGKEDLPHHIERWVNAQNSPAIPRADVQFASRDRETRCHSEESRCKRDDEESGLAQVRILRLRLRMTDSTAPVFPDDDLGRAAWGWGRTRAMVKIQDGCSQACSYCVVPMVRGKSKSIDPAIVLQQVGSLLAQGYREIVLTGSNIGAYRHNGTPMLSGLVQMILGKISVERLRLSSLQAQEITPELVSLWQDHRLCRHVHLPLQSGSDTVLHRMKRRYNVGDFRNAVHLLRDSIPDLAITTDVIVGFPGETEAEFAETETLCKDVCFARTHLFPYSPRPGTAAASLPQRVDPKLVRARLAKMQEIARQSSQRFKEQFVGKVLPVLWERPVKGDEALYSGLTDNYIRVYATTSSNIRNRILHTRLTRIEEGNVFGDIIEP